MGTVVRHARTLTAPVLALPISMIEAPLVAALVPCIGTAMRHAVALRAAPITAVDLPPVVAGA